MSAMPVTFTTDDEYELPSVGIAPGPWRKRGQCVTSDPDDFYPDSLGGKGTPEYKQAKRRALAACDICPVQETCLNFALENDIRYGIWGNKTPSQRRGIKYPRVKSLS